MAADEILKLRNASNLIVPCDSINGGLLQRQQLFVNGICRGCGRCPDDSGDIFGQLILVSFPVGEQFIQCLYYGCFQILFVNRPGMEFKSCRLQSADTAPDDGFASVVVPMDAPEYLATVSAGDKLGEAVIAAVGAFLPVGAGVDHPPADQFFLHPQENLSRNNRFMIAFHIVLRDKAVILDAGLIQKVRSVGLLHRDIDHDTI